MAKITIKDGIISSSANYGLYHGTSKIANVEAGGFRVEGDIIAENLVVSSSVTHLTQSFSSGSTVFGDTFDDVHSFTGSIHQTGSSKNTFTNEVEINSLNGLDVNAGAATILVSHTNGTYAQYSGYGLAVGTANTTISNFNKINFTTPSTIRMVISSSGYVGIANSNPGKHLHIGDGTGIPNLKLSGTNTGTNPAATGHGASNIILHNASATDGNFSFIDGNNSNDAVDSRIVFIHDSHSSRHGEIGFLVHDGSALTERIRFDKSGNVGIGTTSPQNQVHISGNTNSNLEITTGTTGLITLQSLNDARNAYEDLRLYGDDVNINANVSGKVTFTATTLSGSSTSTGSFGSVVAADNIAIGTTTGISDQGAKLHIFEDDSSFGSTTIHVENAKSDDAAIIVLEGARTSENDTGQLVFRNSNDNVAGIKAYSGHSSNNDSGELRFFVSADGSGDVISTAMTIDTNQRVGIGETSPDELLHIKSSTASEPVIKLENSGDVTNGAQIHFVMSTTGEGDDDIPGTIRFKGMNSANTETEFSTIYTRNIDVTDGTEDSEMHFRTMNAGTLDSHMMIKSGNVGIGTTSPGFALEVVGPGTANGSTLNLSDVVSSNDSKHLLITRSSSSGSIGIAGSQANDPLFFTRSGGYDLMITKEGRTGLGNSTPSYKLDITGDSSAPSATAAASAVVGISAAAAGNELVIGNDHSNNQVWLQNRHKSASGNKYKILINPQGGDVTIGNADTLTLQSSTVEMPTANAILSGSATSTGSFGKINAADHLSVGRHQGPSFTADSAIFPLQVVGTDTDDTAAVLIQNSNTGDANILFNISGQSFMMGIDNSESGDPFVISDSSDLSTTARMTIASSGVISGDFNDTSDIALKENIFEISSSYEKVKQLNPVTFNWKEEEEKGTDEQIGFIAQEVEKVYPQLVRGEEGKKSVNVVGLVSVLTKTVQELTQKVEELEKKLQ